VDVLVAADVGDRLGALVIEIEPRAADCFRSNDLVLGCGPLTHFAAATPFPWLGHD
jgi:iron-sulfur cluster repair protein YtfE (RIC family)